MFHSCKIVTHKENCSSFALAYFTHFTEALSLEFGITYGKNLIYDEYFWFEVSRNRKCKPHPHTRAIVLHRCIQEILNTAECHNLIKSLPDLSSSHTENRPVEEYILPAREFHMKSCPDLQQ